MRRQDFVFAALIAAPLTTIAATALPATASPNVRLVALYGGGHHHGGTASPSASATATATDSASPSAGPSAPATHQHGQDAGPSPQDFIDIRQVQPRNNAPQLGQGASKGSFTARCGRNQNNHRNPDNFIVAPGVANGAHHTHDYVGNLSTDGFSTDQSLLAAGTTCQGGTDKSAYFWPVLRIRKAGDPAGQDGNSGTILTPSAVTLQFRGNAASKVTAMPQFLRIITGDAKAATNGGANALAQWTCTGFTNRITTKYPLCPAGSQVQRILDFPSCWNGTDIDSANHRTHVVFPTAATGACPAGTKPVPQLHEVLTYSVPQNQGRAIALDTFPEELHNPVTDHADFENVMTAALMQQVVNCTNTGRRC